MINTLSRLYKLTFTNLICPLQLSSSDNSNYTGNFRNGKKSGMGTFVQCDKTVYRGMWENDLRLE